MGYINQEPTLFGTSIYENIRYGRPEATREEVPLSPLSFFLSCLLCLYLSFSFFLQIETAAKEANAHDFIASFPLGYNTVVGERGVTLSGGMLNLFREAIFHSKGLENFNLFFFVFRTTPEDCDCKGAAQKPSHLDSG